MSTTTSRVPGEDAAVLSAGSNPTGPGAGAGSARAVRRRRRRVRTVAGVGTAVLVVGAGVAAALGFGGGTSQAPARSGLPPATAQVTRTTLTQTETVSGTLGYGDAVTLNARPASAGTTGVAGGGSGGTAGSGSGGTAGIITWLPAAGSKVARGKPVYKADDHPVVLIYGSIPMYRALAPGDEGNDVKQLEKNLSALGYTGFTVDDQYTDATAAAVSAWQGDLGLDETGTVDVSQVVVAPGEIRIAEHKAAVGDSASGPVLTWTGTTRLVTVNLDVRDQQFVRKGIAATVDLPDGKSVAGTVSSVGTVGPGRVRPAMATRHSPRRRSM